MTPSTVAQAAKRIENDKAMATIANACRDSFHSLIGDIWVSGIQTGFFSGKTGGDNSLPPMFLWDSNIPRPNPHTITAWYLTLEDPFILTDAWKTMEPVVRPPMGIDPYHFTPVDVWNSFEPPGFLGPSVQGIRTNLQNTFAHEHKWQVSFSGGFTPTGFESQCTEIDFLAFLQEKKDELELLAVAKLALLNRVLTPPGLSLTSNTTAHPGIQMRLWATKGLWVFPEDFKDEEERATFASSPAKLIKSGAKQVDIVPLGTPRFWFGFTNEHEAAEFMKTYFKFRHIAIDMVQGNRQTAGVVNPEWEATLSKLGMLVESDEDSAVKTSKTKAKADAFSAALAGMQFDF